MKQLDFPRDKFDGDSWGRERREGLLIKQVSLWRCARASSEKTMSWGNAIRSAQTQVHVAHKSMYMPDVCFVASLSRKTKDFVKNDSSLKLYFEVFGSPLVFESIPHQRLNRNTLTIMFKVTDFQCEAHSKIFKGVKELWEFWGCICWYIVACIFKLKGNEVCFNKPVGPKWVHCFRMKFPKVIKKKKKGKS